MAVPPQPKIYHIVHMDRLLSIISDSCLWCDAEIVHRAPVGTTIGMKDIKQRRLNELTLTSHPDLYVGQCVPFYFCPRSIMLYLIHQSNHPEMIYKGGQDPIVHLEFDLNTAVSWSEMKNLRWAFTLSNAGSRFFEDRCNLKHLNEIEWSAVQARNWQSCKEGKQAEFLVEKYFPWKLVERIGVHSARAYQHVANMILKSKHKPYLEVKPDWYY